MVEIESDTKLCFASSYMGHLSVVAQCAKCMFPSYIIYILECRPPHGQKIGTLWKMYKRYYSQIVNCYL